MLSLAFLLLSFTVNAAPIAGSAQKQNPSRRKNQIKVNRKDSLRFKSKTERTLAESDPKPTGKSNKSYKTTAVLSVIVGAFGADQFYLGNYVMASAKLLTFLGSMVAACFAPFYPSASIVSTLSMITLILLYYYNVFQLLIGDVFDGDNHRVPFKWGEVY